jgi:hypothetical protein
MDVSAPQSADRTNLHEIQPKIATHPLAAGQVHATLRVHAHT